MPSFDIVSEVDLQEVDNALNQALKEIGTRYDFKGSKCDLKRDQAQITATADNDFKLEQMLEVLRGKLTRRQVDAKSLEYGKVEPASGGTVRQVVTVRQGVDQETARSIVKQIKESKIKVQAAIQGEQVRVTGKKRDDLQQVIALIKEAPFDLPMQYVNFRD